MVTIDNQMQTIPLLTVSSTNGLTRLITPYAFLFISCRVHEHDHNRGRAKNEDDGKKPGHHGGRMRGLISGRKEPQCCAQEQRERGNLAVNPFSVHHD